MRPPCLSGPTLMDTQFGCMKHLTRQLPSLATFSVFITWPGSIFLSTGSLNIEMRLYPVAYILENKYSGTKALILSKFCAVALGGGGRGKGGRLTKLKTWYLPPEHESHVEKLVVRHLRIFHNTPCLLPPPPPQQSFVKPLLFFLSFYWYLSCPGEIKDNYANFVRSRNWLFAICASSIIDLVGSPSNKVFHNL